MEIKKQYAPCQITREHLSQIEELFLKKNADRFKYRFSLYFKGESISTQSKNEFISITNLKGYPESFYYNMYAIKVSKSKHHDREYESEETLFDLVLSKSFFEGPEVSVSAHKVEDVYSVLEEIQKICNLKAPPKEVKKQESQKQKSVFIAHSFDKKGKAYGQILARFLQLLEYDVKSGDKYSPERVDAKIKKRFTTQEILMIIYSPKADYTWLHQEAGGGAFVDKPVFIFKEKSVKIKEGIFKGREYLVFPAGNIEKTFIEVIEGLEEIDYR